MQPLTPPDPLEQAKAARVRSRQGFLDAVTLGAEGRKVIEVVKDHYHRNHIGEGLEQIWARRRRDA